MPPPRPVTAKAPRQGGAGCGTFLIGMLILASVLALMFVFASGIADNFFAGLFGGSQRPVPTIAPPVIAATLTPEPTPTSTTTPVPTVTVPPLVGLSEAAAASALVQLQLLPVVQQVNSETILRGFVISQELAPGTQLGIGAPVTFTVSLGPSTVALPDWRNFSLNAARSQVESLGLRVEVLEEPSSSIDAGFVIRQSPSPGLVVQPGATVTLVVSLGDQLRFPTVIGLDRAAAENILRAIDGIAELTIDEQGRDRLGEQFDQFRVGEVISAAIFVGEDSLQPVQNGDLIPRGSRVVLGVRALE
jgi:serine/threonine-protein kinase